MIIYTVKQTECLNGLIQSISKNNNRFWMHGSFPLERVNTILPKLCEKYHLQQDSEDRKSLGRHGDPMWTLHIHFDPTRIGYLYFWLLTTGYRNTERNKRTQDEIDSLNTALMIKENLNDIYTTNPEKTLRFGRYVLGQYINYEGLKAKNSKTYLHPDTYGVMIKPDVLKELKERQGTLVLNTIDRSKNTITIDESLSKNELESYENIKKIFGSIFLKDQEETLNKYTKEEVISILQKKFGIKMPPDTDYNHLLHLLFKSLSKVDNRYIDIFKRHATKQVVFTWYLSTAYIGSVRSELTKKISRIPSGNYQAVEEAMRRLYAKGNFHGARHQIGTINAGLRSKIKETYPNHYKKMVFPTELHYTRFSTDKYENFREFQQACNNEVTIWAMKQEELKKRSERLRNIRKVVRQTNPELLTKPVGQLNKAIIEADKTPITYFTPQEKDINNFIQENPVMNPDLYLNL